MAFAPIFIVGVPRSGTTLLRVLLDSHSQILALPETPWMAGAYGGEPSLREILQGLIDGPFGPVRNISGVDRGHVLNAGRRFLEELFKPVLEQRSKTKLAFKTPADIRHLDFLKALFPDAHFIHITRDGRDVSMSQMAKRGTFFSDLKEYHRLSFANVFKRWVEWERRARELLHRDDVRLIHVHYEDLIANPERELRRIAQFLSVSFEPGMLEYAAKTHDYPSWEAGSTDVAKHGGLSSNSVGKWQRIKLTPEMLYTLARYDHALVEFGYPSSNLAPNVLERVLVAGFPIVKPVLDFVSGAVERLKPWFRDVPRSLVSVGWLLLAAQFLAAPTRIFGLDIDRYQPLLCFVQSMAFAVVFGPVLLKRYGLTGGFIYAAISMAAALGVLGLAQNVVPGPEFDPNDLLLDVGAALAALAVFLPFLSSSRARLRES